MRRQSACIPPVARCLDTSELAKPAVDGHGSKNHWLAATELSEAIVESSERKFIHPIDCKFVTYDIGIKLCPLSLPKRNGWIKSELL